MVVCKFNSRIYRSPFIRAHTHTQTNFLYQTTVSNDLSLSLSSAQNESRHRCAADVPLAVSVVLQGIFFFFGCCRCRCGWLCVLGLLETDAHIRITHTREMFFCCSLMLVDCLTPMPPPIVLKTTRQTHSITPERECFFPLPLRSGYKQETPTYPTHIHITSLTILPNKRF